MRWSLHPFITRGKARASSHYTSLILERSRSYVECSRTFSWIELSNVIILTSLPVLWAPASVGLSILSSATTITRSSLPLPYLSNVFRPRENKTPDTRGCDYTMGHEEAQSVTADLWNICSEGFSFGKRNNKTFIEEVKIIKVSLKISRFCFSWNQFHFIEWWNHFHIKPEMHRFLRLGSLEHIIRPTISHARLFIVPLFRDIKSTMLCFT